MAKTNTRYSRQTMDLFESVEAASPPDESLDRTAPLAARMRPRTLDEFVGQEEIVGPGRSLRRMIESGQGGNIILWGPPGTGKTTLARILARQSGAHFVPFSAVSEGVPRIREILDEAERRKRNRAQSVILFVDEAHALRRHQQDVLLPALEGGVLRMVAATTENVSFELNPALLSRCQVFALTAVDETAVRKTLVAALDDKARGLGEWSLSVDDEALDLAARLAGGDVRRGLTILEVSAALVSQGGRITVDTVQDASQGPRAHYDKGRDARYDFISAFQKSIRNSDPQAAIYYLACMIEGGEDHRYIGRRLAVIAAEDIGLADPQALPVTMAAIQNMEFVGPPEGWLAFAEATIYLATAPKSNRSYLALGAALEEVRQNPGAGVPKALRNAPTDLMKAEGYGGGYEYPFDRPEHVSPMACLPEGMEGREFFRPSRFGFESDIKERLAWWAQKKSEGGGG